MKNRNTDDAVGPYDANFYAAQMEGSYRSAMNYVRHLSTVYKPDSVIDVGCGRGMWLKAFREQGTNKLVGIDGNWNSQDKIIDNSIEFRAVDLNALEISKSLETFDLAMSLEVAEHLEKKSAIVLVDALVTFSEVVLFGAAYRNQGGTDHINEQKHTYWAEAFIDRGYHPIDFFRPKFWGNREIEFWYQQNTFLYVKKGNPLLALLGRAGYPSVENIEFLNCVHPDLYETKIRELESGSLTRHLARRLIPKSLRSAVKRKA